MTPDVVDRSTQKWILAFILLLLALSNVFHPVVKDPTKFLIENLPYDLFPQGVLENNNATTDDASSNVDSSNNNNDNKENDPLHQNDILPEDHQISMSSAAAVALQTTTATTTNTNTSDAWDHLVMRFRKDPTAVKIPPHSIPVMLWPYQDKGFHVDSADMVHIEKNGVLESSVLYLAPKAVRTLDEPNIVWLTDVKFPRGEWCKKLIQKAQKTVGRRLERNLTLQWPIFVVDFTDQRTYHRCKGLEEIVGKDFVIYSKRSVVVNRVWDESKNWVSLGTKVLQQPSVAADNATTVTTNYEHMPLIVRTDIVESMPHILEYHHKAKLSDPIEKLWNRSVDIAHYWPSDGRSGIGRFQRELRTKVSRTIEHQLAASYQVFCGVTGTADRMGRRKPQTAYVRHMLNTKIVVVSQRDEWEGHYRLYEALISGAMVMSDEMLILSRLGLENGTSIVEFDSAHSLVSLAEYYLTHEQERIAIAAKGRQVAMSQHRSWHRMEEIVLGRIVTECHAEGCPYIVHNANE